MTSLFHKFCYQGTKANPPNLAKPKANQDQFLLQPNFSHLIWHTYVTLPDQDCSRLTRSMFKALGANGRLFSLFVISLFEGA